MTFDETPRPVVPTSVGGRLLVATPILRDGVFDDTVVFVLAHGDDGTLGVVLNQPLDESIRDTLPRWHDLADAPGQLFAGGPVDTATLVGVATTEEGGEGFAAVPGALPCFTMDLDLDATLAATHVTHLRMFSGYAGWGPGQLQAEILAGAWFVTDARHSDVYTAHPELLWEKVLRRQPDSRRWFIHYPDDPQFN